MSHFISSEQVESIPSQSQFLKEAFTDKKYSNNTLSSILDSIFLRDFKPLTNIYFSIHPEVYFYSRSEISRLLYKRSQKEAWLVTFPFSPPNLEKSSEIYIQKDKGYTFNIVRGWFTNYCFFICKLDEDRYIFLDFTSYNYYWFLYYPLVSFTTSHFETVIHNNLPLVNHDTIDKLRNLNIFPPHSTNKEIIILGCMLQFLLNSINISSICSI